MSPDGTYLHPPAPTRGTDADGVVWSIDSALWVTRDGKRTNGQGVAAVINLGKVFVKSPNAAKGLHWYEWTGSATANKWRDTGTSDDPTGQPMPLSPLVVTFSALVWDGFAWSNDA